ncbi:calcineurin-like phosphoesterase [Hirsutella rhossiliensis]|uniref:Calcineurin-like phosphoesterase domain-containing protein n=1 Tax=Hirsutella rhossiliensis TaxID=111463 RepID=A0A9P8MW23_9HYPO|nr:calcineurin-like phosphoesterase domain-containing protein [Hirsutella rhossiliensis]KAH0963293.1 calcineurin-like phosphoesterase domain-containing protein [Hirsutella rhossiliensis]
MSFFHVNDVHAHLDQFTKFGTDCTDPAQDCYGGYARIKTKVDELRKLHPDSLFLNAGDEFQGTLFYSVYGGDKIAETLNDLNFDAMTLGNHEWDGGDEALGKFLKQLKFPIVSCNVKSTYSDLKDTIKNYQIFPAHQLAVIGVTTETTATTSQVGPGTKFLDPIPEVQKTIDEIRKMHPEIRRIVALTHLGYDEDKRLAAETEGLSLIIGGHTNTLLGDMPKAEGAYPTIQTNLKGHEVFIVTAYRWGEYLGSIEVTFDTEGKALAYRGAPVHMDKTVEQEKTLQEKITSWRTLFEQYTVQVGETMTNLEGEDCWEKDCLLGQVLADAILDYRLKQLEESEPRPDFSFINSGIIRASISSGKITKGDLKTCFPFETTLVEATFTGAELRKIIEGCVSKVNQFNQNRVTSWFQVSDGMAIKYDQNKKAGSQVARVAGPG